MVARDSRAENSAAEKDGRGGQARTALNGAI